MGLTLGAATALSKKGKLTGEGSRKFIHIALGNWWLIALWFFDSPLWAAAVPALFVVVNYLSYRFQLVKAMERGEGRGDLGTVWYAVSLLVVAIWSFTWPEQKWAGTVALLSMGYGDGLAAVVGKRFGKHSYPLPGLKKTLEGSAVLFAAVFVVTLVVSLVAGRPEALALALIAAAVATALELATPLGLDNLSLPLGVGALMVWSALPDFPMALLLGFSLSLLIILPAWNRKTLTLPAAIGAVAMGALLYWAGGAVPFAALVLFFLTATVAGRLGKARKRPIEEQVHAKSGGRTLVQVLANGAIPTVCAVLWKLTGFEPLAVACLTSFAAANADTWSSELGMLSRTPPKSILTGKPVRPGLSGGVTALGFAGAAIGSAVITAVSLFHDGGAGSILPTWLIPAIVFVGGITGSVLDSVFGDTIQAKFLHPVTRELTEKRLVNGVKATLQAGWHFVNNDVVNLLSCFGASVLGGVAVSLLR